MGLNILQIPPEIILELDQIVDLSLDDFKNLRLVHPNLTDIFAPRVLRNVTIPLSAVVNQRDSSKETLHQSENGTTKECHESLISSSLLEMVTSDYRDHIKRLRIQAISPEQIPGSPLIFLYGNKSRWSTPGKIIMDKLSELLQALSSLEVLHLHASVPIIGYDILPMVIRNVSSQVQGIGVQFELTLDGMTCSNYNFSISESIDNVSLLTIRGDMYRAAFVTGAQLANVINRCPMLTSLKFDIKGWGIPLLHMINPENICERIYGPVRNEINIETLHIDGNMLHQDEDPSDYDPIPNTMIGRLRNLRELRISRYQCYPDVVHEFWEAFKEYDIWLEVLSTKMFSLELVDYLSTPMITSTLKVLHIDGILWHYPDVYDTVPSAADFTQHVVPNLCNVLEELAISVQTLCEIYDDLQEEEAHLTVPRILPWSLEKWANGAHSFSRLKKLETAIILPAKKTEPVAECDPKEISKMLYDFPNLREVSFVVVVTESAPKIICHKRSDSDGPIFKQGAELYLDTIAFRNSNLEVLGREKSEYFYGGKKWHLRVTKEK